MKIFLIGFLSFSLFVNFYLYFRGDNCKNEKFYYEILNEAKNDQLNFLINSFFNEEFEINLFMFISYLDKNGISYKEIEENGYFYIAVEYFTFRFDMDGKLLSVVPDR